MRQAGKRSSSSAPALQSAACPPVSRNASGRQKRSVRAWILVVRPPRERPMAWLCSPLAPCGAAVGLHGGGVDQHLRGRPASSGQRLEQLDPDPLGRPAHEAIVEGLLRPVEIAWRVRPAPSRFQHVDDAADHAPVVHALLAPCVVWKKRCDLRELLVRQPEMVHRPLPPEP